MYVLFESTSSCLGELTRPPAIQMGIDAMPPCPPGSSPFSTCRLMHLSLVREGVYSSWAQSQVVPAQYWREEGRLEDYYRVNTFLKDINNEREGDEQVGSTTARVAEEVPRNSSYKENFESLNRLVLIRFSYAPFPLLPSFSFSSPFTNLRLEVSLTLDLSAARTRPSSPPIPPTSPSPTRTRPTAQLLPSLPTPSATPLLFPGPPSRFTRTTTSVSARSTKREG